MKTASFFAYSGPGRISVARFAPRGHPAGYKVYKLLAPGPWFKSVDFKTYETLYHKQLKLLDPQNTWDELHKLADGAEPVLLCYERWSDVKAGRTYCHRHMAAEWFFDTLGFLVPEQEE